MSTVNYISLPMAAALLGKSEREVRKLAAEGKFGAVKEGRSWKFDRDQVSLLTVEQVAEVLHVNVQTVRRWARDKMHPSVKIGRRYYFTLDALTAMKAPH